MTLEKKVKQFLKTCGIKIRNYAIYEEGDYAIDTYEDFFLGMWVGNETVYYKGAEIMHATLEKARKQEELPQRLKNILEARSKLMEKKHPIKEGPIKELIEVLKKGDESNDGE